MLLLQQAWQQHQKLWICYLRQQWQQLLIQQQVMISTVVSHGPGSSRITRRMTTMQTGRQQVVVGMAGSRQGVVPSP
jgi:hypothetical protein